MVVDGGPGSFEGALNRFLGGIEHLGDLARAVAQNVAQHEYGALARRQQLQGGDERERDGLGGLVAGLRTGRLVDEVVEQDVGVGFQPGRGVAGAGGFGQGQRRAAGGRCGGVGCRRAACSGTGWSRSDTARSAARTAGRSRRGYARRTRGSPGVRPRRPAGIPGCGSSAPATRGSGPGPGRGTRCGRRPEPGRSGPSCPSPSACILAFLLSAGRVRLV